jgi:hypothetical protein
MAITFNQLAKELTYSFDTLRSVYNRARREEPEAKDLASLGQDELVPDKEQAFIRKRFGSKMEKPKMVLSMPTINSTPSVSVTEFDKLKAQLAAKELAIDRLSEYADYKMPIFIIQDPDRKLQVDTQARMVRDLLVQSGNTLLNIENDVHELYYRDPRHKAAVETPAEYLTRVEAYKKKVTEGFMNRQLKQVGDFSHFKSIYFNQDLTPPTPVSQRFRLFNWG